MATAKATAETEAKQSATLATPKGKKKGRSPAYPGIDLERALELARTLYKQERHHPAAQQTIFQHWGVPSTSSFGMVAISALRKYGLVETFGQRGPQSGQVKLSDVALNILLDDREDSPDRQVAIQRVALTPDIHAELWRKYQGTLPSDQNLRFHLIRERGFTERGADEFIGEFRRTIAFARLGPDTVLSEQNNDKMEGQKEPSVSSLQPVDTERSQPRLPAQSATGQIREVPIPIQGSAWPALKAAFPLSEEAWTQMIAVLNAMKPGLVELKKES